MDPRDAVPAHADLASRSRRFVCRLLWRGAIARVRPDVRWLAPGTDIVDVAAASARCLVSILFRSVLSAALASSAPIRRRARDLAWHRCRLFGVAAAGLIGARCRTLADRRLRIVCDGLALMVPAAGASRPSRTARLLPLLVIGSPPIRATTTEVLIVDNTQPERRSTVLGTYYLVNQPVGGIAAPVFGAVAGAIGIGAAYGWLAVIFLVLSAVALIAAWPTARGLRRAAS